MHNLVIDIGNTYSKLAVFKQREILYFEQFNKIDAPQVAKIIEQYKIKQSTVSSVNEDISSLEKTLKAATNYVRFTTEIVGKINNHYQSPNTLGLDRWAKVIAAHCLYPGKNTLMVDAGTCLTYDVLNAENEYFGGSISLGISLRFKALNQFTERLPLVAWDKEQLIIAEGTDTQKAIARGVLQGAVNEVEGFIALENNRNKDLQVIITGGDAVFLNKQLKNSIFVSQIIHEPYLVLKGLNEVITL